MQEGQAPSTDALVGIIEFVQANILTICISAAALVIGALSQKLGDFLTRPRGDR